MALARGTPAGSLSTSKLIAGPGSVPDPGLPTSQPAAPVRLPATPATSATPATPDSPRPVTAAPARRSVCRRCDNAYTRMSSLSQRRQLADARHGSRVAARLGGMADARAGGGSRPGPGARRRRSSLAPAGAGVAGGEADGVLGAVEQFLAQRGRYQHARLVLQHPGVEGGEDRPDPGLIQPPHDELGALRVVELQPHHQAVLPDA